MGVISMLVKRQTPESGAGAETGPAPPVVPEVPKVVENVAESISQAPPDLVTESVLHHFNNKSVHHHQYSTTTFLPDGTYASYA